MDAPMSDRPDRSKMISVRVGNIPFDLEVDELRTHFAKFGEIGDVYVPRDRNTGRGRGFAYVRFMDQKSADDAIAEANDTEVFGRTMRVEMATEPRGAPRGRGGDRFGDRRGGFGGRGRYGDRGDRRGGDRDGYRRGGDRDGYRRGGDRDGYRRGGDRDDFRGGRGGRGGYGGRRDFDADRRPRHRSRSRSHDRGDRREGH